MNRDDALKSMPDDELQALLKRKGDSIYVVMNAAGSSIMRDPGTGQPFRTEIKKRAQQVANDAVGYCVTWNEAFAQLNKYYKEHPEFVIPPNLQ